MINPSDHRKKKKIQQLRGRRAVLEKKLAAIDKAHTHADEEFFRWNEKASLLANAMLGVTLSTPTGSKVSEKKETRILPRYRKAQQQAHKWEKQRDFLLDKASEVEEKIVSIDDLIQTIETGEENPRKKRSTKKRNPRRRHVAARTARAKVNRGSIRRNKTIIKAKRVIAVTNRTKKAGRRRNVALPASSSELRSAYDLKSLRAQAATAKRNVRKFDTLSKKFLKEIKAESERQRSLGGQMLQRSVSKSKELLQKLADVDRLRERQLEQLEKILSTLGRVKGSKAAKRRNPRRRHNSVTSKVKSLFQTFSGKKARREVSVNAAKNAPAKVSKLGRLRKIKLKSGQWYDFEGSKAPYLAADGRHKLHIVGGEYRANPSGSDMGEIDKIVYEAAKPHLGQPSTGPYVHSFGEEGGKRPHLKIDGEGLMHISGGSYTIEAEGIRD